METTRIFKRVGIDHTYYIIQFTQILQVKNLYEIKQRLIFKYKDYLIL